MLSQHKGRVTAMDALMPTLGRLDTDFLEPFGLLHGPDDGLYQLLDLLVQAADVGVLLGGLFVHLHRLDSAVVLGGQGVEDQVRVLVDADEVGGLEGVGVNKADEREEDGLPGRRLDDGRLAYAGGIEIDIGTLF